jgi:hypothetical protein
MAFLFRRGANLQTTVKSTKDLLLKLQVGKDDGQGARVRLQMWLHGLDSF